MNAIRDMVTKILALDVKGVSNVLVYTYVEICTVSHWWYVLTGLLSTGHLLSTNETLK